MLLTAQATICSERGIVEIGVLAGKSAAVLATAAEDGEALYLCDPHTDTELTPVPADIPSLEETADWLSTEFPAVRFIAFGRPSGELGDFFARVIDHKLRAVHIDGDHTAPAVRTDLATAKRVVTEDGGLVVVDDYRLAEAPGIAATFWPWLATDVATKCVVLSRHRAYVLFGPSWAPVLAHLPMHTEFGRRAGEDVVPGCRILRYEGGG